MVATSTKDLLDATDPYYGFVHGKHPVLPHPESVLGTQVIRAVVLEDSSCLHSGHSGCHAKHMEMNRCCILAY